MDLKVSSINTHVNLYLDTDKEKLSCHVQLQNENQVECDRNLKTYFGVLSANYDFKNYIP